MNRLKWISQLLLGLGLAAVASPAGAHPGHGTTEPVSLAHYALEPLHAWQIVAVIVVAAGTAVFGWQRCRQPSRQR